MRSIIDALNEEFVLVNLATGETVTVLGCSGESALYNHLDNAYIEEHWPLVFGENTVACGDWCTVQWNRKRR